MKQNNKKRLAQTNLKTADSNVVKPTSAIKISDDKKADILLSIMIDIRQGLKRETELSYNSTVWSIGLLVSISGVWLYIDTRTTLLRLLLTGAILLFGLLTQWYLYILRKSFYESGQALAKIQAALVLCDRGAYIKEEIFFNYDGKWFPPTAEIRLAIIHIVAVTFSILVVFLLQ